MATRIRAFILAEGDPDVTELRLSSANCTSFKTRGVNNQRLEVIIIDTREDDEPGVDSGV